MSHGFITRRGGSGSGGLNFSVAGGTAQPVGKENLIWVNTSTAITDWAISVAAPATPISGMVWIITDRSSSAAFSVVKKSQIMIYPLQCKQYVSGAWVSKVAKTYQSGAWVDWLALFYDRGDDFTEFTGGLSSDGFIWRSSSYIKTPEVKNADNIYLNAGSMRYSCVVTQNMVDLTGLDYISINVLTAGGENNRRLEVVEQIDLYSPVLAQVTIPAASGVVTLDVSSINKPAYVAVVAAAASGGSASITFNKLWGGKNDG